MGQYDDIDDVLDVVEYAYLRVPLYMELAEKHHLDFGNYRSLPIVSKDYYIKADAPYLSCDYVRRMLQGQLLQGRTSGSTGKYTDFYWDPGEERRSLLELWYYRKKYYGITPKDRMVYFFPIVQEDSGQEVTETETILGLSKAFLYNHRLMQAYRLIKGFCPKWMILQPSVAWLLCDLIKKENLEKIESVEYIEFTGEYLDEKIRRETEEYFSCKTANQYGLREVNSIAYECPMGHMHIMRSNAYLEIIHENDDGIGDICITSLKNHAMPYIRYNTGDKGCLREMSCSCGNTNPVLEVHKGRDNDWIRISPGERMHPFMLIQLLSEINNLTGDQIIQFQVIQKEYERFEINVVPDQGYGKEVTEELIIEKIRRRINQKIQIDFQYFETLLPDMITGKIAVFVCQIAEH